MKQRDIKWDFQEKELKKKTHSLFIDDLKLYQEDEKTLELVNSTIVQASHDTGARYGVNKCAEAVFREGIMVKRN